LVNFLTKHFRFIDGTRNPDHLLRALSDETIIYPDDFENAQNHTGGSFMYAGKFVHNLKKVFEFNPITQYFQLIN